MLTGTVTAQVINIGATLIITRLYSAESYGEFSLFFSLSTFIGFISAFGFDYLIPKQQAEEDSKALFLLSLFLSTSSFLLSFLLIVLVDIWVEFNAIFYLLPLTSLATSLFLSLNLYFTHFKKFGSISRNKVGQAIWVNGLQVAFKFISKSGGLILGLAIGRIVNVILYLAKIRNEFSIRSIKSQWERVKGVFFLNRSLAAGITQSHILSRGSIEAPVLLISIIFDQVILGFYSLSFRVLALPVSVIANSLEQVLYKEVSDRLNSGKKVTRFILKNWSVLFLISIIPALIIYIAGEPIFLWVFGSEWVESGRIAKILTPLIVLNLINASTGRLLFLVDQVRIPLIFSAINFVFILIAFGVGYKTDSFYTAIILMVILRSISILTFNLIMLRFFHHHHKLKHES